MAMTLDQARQAIITRAMAFTELSKAGLNILIKTLLCRLMDYGVTLMCYGVVRSLLQLVIPHAQEEQGLSQSTAWPV